MELEGLKRCRDQLTTNGLVVDELITDRHASVSKYVREQWPEVTHNFDVWHIAKGM